MCLAHNILIDKLEQSVKDLCAAAIQAFIFYKLMIHNALETYLCNWSHLDCDMHDIQRLSLSQAFTDIYMVVHAPIVVCE